MAVNVYLTDEPSDLAGYRRARVGARSEAASLVRAVTSTEAGPTSGVQVTRSAGGTALAWITDPLAGISLTAATWQARLWAKESAAAANAALRVQVLRWQTGEGTSVLDDNQGTELGTTIADQAITTGAATAATLADGDRLVIKVLIDDAASSMAADQTVTLSYNGQNPRAEGDSYLVCPNDLAVTETMPQVTIARVREILADESQGDDMVTESAVRGAIRAALVTYTQHRPRLMVASLSGDGTAYDFALPRGWVWGVSRLVDVEYPAGEQTAIMVDTNGIVAMERVLGGQPVRTVRFLDTTPASGTDNIVVRYTSRHVHTDELDTVPADHFEALCYLAAANVAETMAARKAESTDSTISAESVNHRDASAGWRSVARAFRSRYENMVGVGGTVAAASATADWDSLSSLRQDRLFHGRRWR